MFAIFGENCSILNGHSSQTKQNTLLKCFVSILHVYKIINKKKKEKKMFLSYSRSKTEANDQWPRMYLLTYAFSDEEANNLFSEFHLGRLALRYTPCQKMYLKKKLMLKQNLFP